MISEKNNANAADGTRQNGRQSQQGAQKGAQKRAQKRAEKTRNQIIEAVISCLDKFGYAETSINAIQSEAGLSRGSMTHHFPTRQDMILAATQQMLDNALIGVQNYFARMGKLRDQTSANLIVQQFWSNIVNTPHGRAFIEIMLASRTNVELREKFAVMMTNWDIEVKKTISGTYPLNSDEMQEIWDFCRTYLRGLLIHTHITRDEGQLQLKIQQFSSLIGHRIIQIEGTPS